MDNMTPSGKAFNPEGETGADGDTGANATPAPDLTRHPFSMGRSRHDL